MFVLSRGLNLGLIRIDRQVLLFLSQAVDPPIILVNFDPSFATTLLRGHVFIWCHIRIRQTKRLVFIAFNVNFIVAVNLYPLGASMFLGDDFPYLTIISLPAFAVESAEGGASSWRLNNKRRTLNKLLPVIFNFYHVFRTLCRTLLITIFIFHLMLNLENNLLTVSR